MILTMSDDNGLISVTADRHIPGDSNTTPDDGTNGPGNPNPLVPKGPRDLFRSRRIGLTRVVCTACRAVRDQGYCHHKSDCTIDEWSSRYGTPKWSKERTGPIPNNATSRHTGWYSDGLMTVLPSSDSD